MQEVQEGQERQRGQVQAEADRDGLRWWVLPERQLRHHGTNDTGSDLQRQSQERPRE
jgi:hypothetical protein